ncbi:MAG: DUF3429 domain-containing protein [Burkholderiales bacterium]|nr:DUF3429 domain-containing protein [Burkholderiales bacterium]
MNTAPPAASAVPSAPSPSPSTLARRLVNAAIVPFVLGALLVWIVREEAHADVTLALVAYAAVIVAFVGGVHWGLALRLPDPPRELLLWGLLPTLVSWLAVVMRPGAGLVIVGVMLVAGYLIDRHVYVQQGVAHWLTLRFRLAAIAALSCFVAAAGS